MYLCGIKSPDDMQPVRYNASQLYKKLINVYTERVPNPEAMKFVVNTMLIADETANRDYPDATAAQESPLALALFELPYISRVFVTKNFVTLTKTASANWEEIMQPLRQFLKDYLEAEKPVMHGDETPQSSNEHAAHDSEHVRKIKDILEEYIRPAVEMDGGAISFHSFDETSKTVKVLLQGSCSGCPSSTITLKAGIENLLKRMMPDQVQTVVAEGV
jgi:Fe-S cluster biogenesis protein NfuA